MNTRLRKNAWFDVLLILTPWHLDNSCWKVFDIGGLELATLSTLSSHVKFLFILQQEAREKLTHKYYKIFRKIVKS